MNALYLTEITIVAAALVLLPLFKRACDDNWELHKLMSYARVDVQLTIDISVFQEAMKKISQAAREMEKSWPRSQ